VVAAEASAEVVVAVAAAVDVAAVAGNKSLD